MTLTGASDYSSSWPRGRSKLAVWIIFTDDMLAQTWAVNTLSTVFFPDTFMKAVTSVHMLTGRQEGTTATTWRSLPQSPRLTWSVVFRRCKETPVSCAIRPVWMCRMSGFYFMLSSPVVDSRGYSLSPRLHWTRPMDSSHLVEHGAAPFAFLGRNHTGYD